MRFEDKLPDAQVNVSKQTPLRDAILLASGVVLVCVVLVFVVAGTINLLVPLIPATVEVRVFSLVDFSENESADALLDERRAYVQSMVDGLASHWEGRPYALHVIILEDETPNAFAVPGGYIMVTNGLLKSVKSENELAFVLGHEVGHFQRRDHLRGLGRGLALALVAYGFDLGGARGVMTLLQGAMGIADRHFDRDQESGADKIGLGLVWKEYGHVSGSTDFFTHVDDATVPDRSEWEGTGLDHRIEGYFSTHPLDEARVNALDRLADNQGWDRSRPTRPLELPPIIDTPDPALP